MSPRLGILRATAQSTVLSSTGYTSQRRCRRIAAVDIRREDLSFAMKGTLFAFPNSAPKGVLRFTTRPFFEHTIVSHIRYASVLRGSHIRMEKYRLNNVQCRGQFLTRGPNKYNFSAPGRSITVYFLNPSTRWEFAINRPSGLFGLQIAS